MLGSVVGSVEGSDGSAGVGLTRTDGLTSADGATDGLPIDPGELLGGGVDVEPQATAMTTVAKKRPTSAGWARPVRIGVVVPSGGERGGRCADVRSLGRI